MGRFVADLQRNLEIKDPIIAKIMSGFYKVYEEAKEMEL